MNYKTASIWRDFLFVNKTQLKSWRLRWLVTSAMVCIFIWDQLIVFLYSMSTPCHKSADCVPALWARLASQKFSQNFHHCKVQKGGWFFGWAALVTLNAHTRNLSINHNPLQILLSVNWQFGSISRIQDCEQICKFAFFLIL